MSRLISVAAMLQIADAHFIDPDLSRLLEGEPATSGHPENGPRPEPDELAVGFTPLMAAAGEKRSHGQTRSSNKPSRSTCCNHRHYSQPLRGTG